MSHWIIGLIVFILGLIFGSFLTVCVHRIPNEQSVVSPRSRCPRCGTQIKWYHNIPVFSYLFLQGQCESCQEKIPPRYPLIELVNGLGYLLLVGKFGLTWPTMVYAALFSVFIVVTVIDWDHQIIPDVITLPGIILGFVCAVTILPTGWFDSLVGILVGGGVLLALAWISPLLFGKEGMGGGDIKFMAMVGAFLGWKMVLVALFLGSVGGAVIGITLLLLKVMERGQYIPFGPYLAFGSLVAMVWGPDLWHWYFGGLI